jgi:hypothetical protein
MGGSSPSAPHPPSANGTISVATVTAFLSRMPFRSAGRRDA